MLSPKGSFKENGNNGPLNCQISDRKNVKYLYCYILILFLKKQGLVVVKFLSTRYVDYDEYIA